MRSLNLAIQSEASLRPDTKPSYQPRLISGGLLPLLVTPSLHTNIRISNKVSNSCPPTPFPTQNISPKKNVTSQQIRPQSALYRQKTIYSIPPNEYLGVGEEYLIGYNPSSMEFGEWSDEPIDLYSERKVRQKHPELDLGLKGNSVFYSLRSSKFGTAKDKPRNETDSNDSYLFIPDTSKKYQLQEHSLHSIRPESLLGSEARRRTMDFVLVGQKKETKTDENQIKNISKSPQTETRMQIKESYTSELKPETPNVANISLKLDNNSKNSQKPSKAIKVVIPLPPSPQSKRKNLISRGVIRKFGLSNAVKPNYVPHSRSMDWPMNQENLLKGNSILQSSSVNLTLSRPHSVIA